MIRFVLMLALAGITIGLPTAVYAEAATHYTCPMHPEIIADKPGRCPICGMDLVPMAPHHHDDMSMPQSSKTVTLDEGAIQKIGVRTEKVQSEAGVLSVSNSAILRDSSGTHVIAALGDGKFRGQNVTIGEVAHGRTEVLSGLNDGDEVVTRAQFMIDSESSLQEALEQFKAGSHASH